MKYIKQFDSIRGIAIIFIVFYHWLSGWDKTSAYINKIPAGFAVVDVFFVLSGFLISRILMTNKNEAEQQGIGKVQVFKFFFIRRALRIFPIYYLVIFLLFLLDENLDRQSFPYFATYTSNFYFYSAGKWHPVFSHLWTLAVEEQFYLFWPWLLLFVSNKYMPWLIGIFIATGVLSEYFVFGNEFGQCLTFTCFDSLGLGAMVAWISLYRSDLLTYTRRLFGVLTIINILLLAAEAVNGAWTFIPVTSVLSVFTVWFLTYIIQLTQSPSYKKSWLWDNKTLIFIGKISYGIYLYHLMLPNYSGLIFYPLNEYLPAFLTKHYFVLFFLENFILLFLVAWLSWVLIEKPFMNLKKYFSSFHKKASAKAKQPPQNDGLQTTLLQAD